MIFCKSVDQYTDMFIMLYGQFSCTFFCTNRATLCPKVFVSHAEWFEEQRNESCKKNMQKREHEIDCELLENGFTALKTEYQEHRGTWV
jgi:hypothetical protein